MLATSEIIYYLGENSDYSDRIRFRRFICNPSNNPITMGLKTGRKQKTEVKPNYICRRRFKTFQHDVQ